MLLLFFSFCTPASASLPLLVLPPMVTINLAWDNRRDSFSSNKELKSWKSSWLDNTSHFKAAHHLAEVWWELMHYAASWRELRAASIDKNWSGMTVAIIRKGCIPLRLENFRLNNCPIRVTVRIVESCAYRSSSLHLPHWSMFGQPEPCPPCLLAFLWKCPHAL